MNSKTLIWLGLLIGSTTGSFIPLIWGAGMFSFSAVIFSALGGIVGIWIMYKATR
ncbi:MAG TPA: hypothetical protein PK720_03990 [bacterium]|jgi:hypothetical protein|nr:hypothetical protein [bacterium]